MRKPVVAMIRATYTEQNALETFFTGLFGVGRSQVIVSYHSPLHLAFKH